MRYPFLLLAALGALLAGCGEAPASPERVALALRQVVAAQAHFHEQSSDGQAVYARTFAELAAWLDDPELAAGHLPGYTLELAGEAGGRWSLRATPLEPGAPAYFVDAFGFLRRSEAAPADRNAPLETPAAPVKAETLRNGQAARDLREIAARQGLFAMLAGGAAQGRPRFARSLAELRQPGPVSLVSDDYAYVIEAPQPETGWTAWAVPCAVACPLLFVDQSGTMRYETDRAPGPRSPRLP